MCINNTCPQQHVGYAFLHLNQPLSTIPDSFNTMFPISTTTKFLSLTTSHLFQFQLDLGPYKTCYAIINPNRFENAFQAIHNAFNETKGSFRLPFLFFCGFPFLFHLEHAVELLCAYLINCFFPSFIQIVLPSLQQRVLIMTTVITPKTISSVGARDVMVIFLLYFIFHLLIILYRDYLWS